MSTAKRSVKIIENHPQLPIELQKPVTGRYVRPSQFLNELTLLPLIQQTKATSELSKGNGPKMGSLEQLPNLSEIKLPAIKHKHNYSQPLLPTPSLTESKRNILKIHDQKRQRTIFQEDLGQPQRAPQKHVTFRKSILLVDLQLGVISKGIIDGGSKPIHRLVRKGTQSIKTDLDLGDY